MIVTEIWRYPVKTMGGEKVQRARIGPLGIEGDRVVHAAFGHDGRRLRPNIVIGGVEGRAGRTCLARR